MPQATHIRLLFSLTAPSLYVSGANPFKISFSSPILRRSITALRAYSRVTALSSSSDRRGRKGGVLPQRRSSGSAVEKRGGDRVPEMEEPEIAKFNKRRAEGRDKNDKPKTLHLKSRKLNPINTICYVQILGTGMDTQDTSPSVLLFFDKQRFIFNSGEGLQRFCTEHRIKLSKIDHMFLTRVCSETAGGLPGLLLTLAGMGDEGMSVNIWGPSDLKYLVDAMRSFIPNAAMVHTHCFGSRTQGNGSAFSTLMEFTDPIVLIDDEVVRISAILLRPSFPKGCSYQMDVLTDSSFLEEKTDLFNESVAPSLQNSDGKAGSMLKPGDIAVIYVCELPEITGKFDPAKAAALGLRPGPKYRELQLGNSVMSDHLNIMVHPSDVLGHSIPGPIVLLVDCPTPAHIWELLSVQSLNCYYTDSTDHPQVGFKSVNCIIHLGPASVTKSTEYQKWMKKFGGVQHIMAGHEIKNIEVPILRSSARITTRLNYMCPHLFPAPGFWSHQQSNFFQESNSSSEDSSPVLSETILAENLLKFHLRPYALLGVDKSVIPSLLTHTEIVNELLSEIPEIADASKHVSHFWNDSLEAKNMTTSTDAEVIMVEEPWLQENACKHDTNTGNQPRDPSKGSEVQHDLDIPGCLDNISREDMEIVLLGTGSSQPSKYRNVSAIYVNLFSKGSLLLDCGEGTLAQLKRRFGVKGADDAVKSLRIIWISHIHADHHTGLARILALRSELLTGVPHDPLVVVGPRQLKRFLDAYSRLEDLDMQFLDCRHTTETSLNTLAASIEAGRDCSPERAVEKDAENGHLRTVSPNLGTTLFAKGNKMQSYWKVDTAGVLPVLMKFKEVLLEAGLEALFSVPVLHCPEAFGVVMKASERINSVGKAIPGWKLVYSGDTRPCQELIAASHGATVLIHEATFEDDMEDEALQRNHSTTMEAIKVGTSAEVYRIILTHFSQRYPKIPVLNDNHMHNTCIAFDLMSVNAADLPVLPKLLPYLKLLFRNEMVLDESDDVQLMPCTDQSGKSS